MPASTSACHSFTHQLTPAKTPLSGPDAPPSTVASRTWATQSLAPGATPRSGHARVGSPPYVADISVPSPAAMAETMVPW